MNKKTHGPASRKQQASSAPLHLSMSEPQQSRQHHAFRSSLAHRASGEPHTLSLSEVQFLQQSLGNRAVAQFFQQAAHHSAVQKAPHQRENTTGLPPALQVGIEQLSGLSLADVRVHYHSSQPAEVGALAYTQGTDIYVGQGQEQHLAHEAWHVVQQKQGRVKPTIQAWGQAINDDQGLEQEAESMGKKAASAASLTGVSHVKKAEDSMGHTTTSMLIPKTIQRVRGVAPQSDPALVDLYIDLLLTDEFQKIHNLVTKGQNLILVDSTATQETGYEPETHTIRIPLKTPDGADRPRPDIRAKILWEMHNALNRGAHTRTNAKFAIPKLATPEGQELIPYHQAALALSAEWDEWIRIVELDFRVGAINQAAGGQEDYVTRRYGEYFANPQQGWYQFEIYLRDQIAAGHTNSYDPYAHSPQWKGHRIIREVKERNPKSLTITEKQVRDWQQGKKAHVKESAINPFKTLAIIEAARFRDY